MRSSRRRRRVMGASVGLALALAGLLAGPPAGAVPRGDPLRARQWGLLKIQAPQAWRRATGKGVLIAVIDNGVDATHEDLRGKVVHYTRPSFGCDDYCTASHGTAVAGIAAAWAGNGKGIAGVAPDARILDLPVGLKVYIGGVGGDSQLKGHARAIRFAVDHGARVINMSFGMMTGYDHNPVSSGAKAVDAAIEYAWQKGAVLVASAGNMALPACDFPASNPRVLCVGAVGPDDGKLWYSQFGVEIDVMAPSAPWVEAVCKPPADLGGYDPRRGLFDIPTWSCQPTWPCDLEVTENIWTTAASGRDQNMCEDLAGYTLFGGTSAAAPFVSGVAALLSSMGLTNAQIVARIERTADDLGAPGYDPVYGWGRVNALRAVRGR
ncbi:MAG: S8 family serine peptidase [Acidobacteria bacterium]|nr:S8 family serine peptidase [Acidobacteriota bacterium]